MHMAWRNCGIAYGRARGFAFLTRDGRVGTLFLFGMEGWERVSLRVLRVDLGLAFALYSLCFDARVSHSQRERAGGRKGTAWQARDFDANK